MSKLVKKHTSYLRLFSDTTSKLQRQALLDTITDDQLRALSEVTINLLQGILPITAAQKEKLGKYKKLLRLIGDPSVSLKKKKISLRRQAKAVALLLTSVEPALKTFLS